MITLPAVYVVSVTQDSVCFKVPDGLCEPIQHLVDSVPSKQISVRLDRPKKPRTTGWRSQSAHFNGHCQTICEETGNDFSDVKMHLKRRAMRRGLPAMTNEKGEVVYSLIDGEPLPKSEADMDTVECGYCIDEAHQLAAEIEIKLKEYDDE